MTTPIWNVNLGMAELQLRKRIEKQRRELLSQEQQQTEQPLPQINPDMAPEATGQEWRG